MICLDSPANQRRKAELNIIEGPKFVTVAGQLFLEFLLSLSGSCLESFLICLYLQVRKNKHAPTYRCELH